LLSGCTTAPVVGGVSTLSARETPVALEPGEVAQPTAVPQPEITAQAGALNPLTGLPSGSDWLNRRPVMIKIQNLPRPREQWGVSRADIVYEYYTEFGTTRFAAIYHGQEPARVGPIRSARWFDMRLMEMYGPVFVFGGAYKELLDALLAADYGDRILLEQPDSCPAICRYDPDEKNYLMVDGPALRDYITNLGVDNTLPDLSGMVFAAQPPANGKPAERVYVRYSTAVYNRWDYDPATGRYLRFADAQDDPRWENEVYEPLMDLQDGVQVGAENVVMVLADYVELVKTEDSQVYDVRLEGSGPAYIARDGQLFNVHWQRQQADDVLTLTAEDGAPFAFKPGQTWFEILGYTSEIDLLGNDWRFTFYIP